MPLIPTEQQQTIVENQTGLFTVRACPGSGKTFTVAARLNHVLGQWQDQHRGIAVASFTNIAWKEIAGYLASEFGRSPLSQPHFLGTLDSFINRYIFLPFGHLVMPSRARPVLTGPPHDDHEPIGSWIWWQNRECNAKGCKLNEFTYDGNRNVIRIGHPTMGFMCPVGGRPCTAKKLLVTQNGYATQADATYFSLLVLKTYPDITKALAYRFPALIVDEAQDTSSQQMAIIDLLIKNGLSEVMLVGDPNQAIYEWREAEPSLFLQKCADWKDNSASLDENWRSSNYICQATSCMFSNSLSMKAVNPAVAGFDMRPQILSYSSESEIPGIAKSFILSCSTGGIETGGRYALTRSKDLVNVIVPGTLSEGLTPWTDNAPLTKTLAKARYLIDQQDYPTAIRLMERVIFKDQQTSGPLSFTRLYPTSSHLAVRGQILSALALLPGTTNKTIGAWIAEAQTIVSQMSILGANRDLKVKKATREKDYSGLRFETIFGRSTDPSERLELSALTVHAAKGTSLDGVLAVLKKKGAGGSLYTNLIAKKASLQDHEELRIVYVALTRARRILWILVPEGDQHSWRSYLGLVERQESFW